MGSRGVLGAQPVVTTNIVQQNALLRIDVDAHEPRRPDVVDVERELATVPAPALLRPIFEAQLDFYGQLQRSVPVDHDAARVFGRGVGRFRLLLLASSRSVEDAGSRAEGRVG